MVVFKGFFDEVIFDVLYAVFDTNWVRNAKSFDHLLGAATDLREISKCATIVIPQMVLDEVLEGKRRTFFDAVKSVNNSLISEIVGLPTIEDHNERWSSIRESLRNDQSIPFRCLDVKDADKAFEEARRLAVNHMPPFDEKTDKGFKDFVIAWTIKELMAENPEDRVIVLTKDGRLKEYIETTLKAETVDSLPEFMQLAQPLQTDAFMQEDVAATSTEKPFGSRKRDEEEAIANLIRDLENASSFSTVHNLMPILEQRYNELTADEKVTLLRIALKNNQVKWLLRNDIVEHSFLPLFFEIGDELNTHEADELAASFRKEPLLEHCADMDMEGEISDTYSLFVRKFEISLISVEPEAHVESLSFVLLPKLKAVLADNMLDERIPHGEDVYECFIEQGKFECMSWGFDFDVLESFVKKMELCGWSDRLLAFRGIASHIRERQDGAA